MAGDVILGYDDTPSARATLEVAIEQAKRFDERLVILFAYAPPGRSAGEEFKEHRRVLDPALSREVRGRVEGGENP